MEQKICLMYKYIMQQVLKVNDWNGKSILIPFNIFNITFNNLLYCLFWNLELLIAEYFLMFTVFFQHGIFTEF